MTSIYDKCQISGCDNEYTHHIYTTFNSYCAHHVMVCGEHVDQVNIYTETKAQRDKTIRNLIGAE